MTYYSSVPAAIAALVTAFKTSTALGIAGVVVRDGPELSAAGAVEAVAVGYAGDPAQAQPVVTGTAAPEGMAAGPDRERYSVFCAVEVIDGGGNLPAARVRAYQLHAACGAAIAADITLGRTVLRATTGLGSLQQQLGSVGALARVTFSVDIDAYTTR